MVSIHASFGPSEPSRKGAREEAHQGTLQRDEQQVLHVDNGDTGAASATLLSALERLSRPLEISIADAGNEQSWQIPALPVGRLGDLDFCQRHQLRMPYIAGAMANGIASVELVEAMAQHGMLGFFGAAGLDLPSIEKAIDRLVALDQPRASGTGPRTEPRRRSWGVNLIFNPIEKQLEAQTVDLLLRRGVRRVSASAYLDLTPEIVRYRAAGLRRTADGKIVADNHVFAKVSRVELAEKFLRPAPQALLDQLRAEGRLTAEQAACAQEVPVASEITAEADSGGHTDHRPSLAQFPSILALRDRIYRECGYTELPAVGAAGGIGTPHAVAAAFAMGAAFVVTGSINQCCVEAGTSDIVREMLCQTEQADVTVAPAADMFEMGITLQVLKRGTMFAMRAQKLYEAYRSHESLEALPPDLTRQLETQIFRRPLKDIWQDTQNYWSQRDPAQLRRAARDPRHKMALVFRWYLGSSSRWANSGVAERRLDFQVWCGPAMGSFNEWAHGSLLEPQAQRSAPLLAANLMVGAAILTRAQQLRQQGCELASLAAAEVRPRNWQELEISLT